MEGYGGVSGGVNDVAVFRGGLKKHGRVPGGDWGLKEVPDVAGPLGKGVLERGEGPAGEADVTGSVLEPGATGILEESELLNENTLVLFTGL